MSKLDFLSTLSNLRSSATFLSLIGYRNAADEVADYSIVFNMSYRTALEKSVMIAEEYQPIDDVEAKAKSELLASWKKSLSKPEQEFAVESAYVTFSDDDGTPIKGVKMHAESGELHLYGLLVHKKVRIPGEYEKSNKSELTQAKDKIKKLCPVSKFRQFKINPDQVEKVSVNKMDLLSCL